MVTDFFPLVSHVNEHFLTFFNANLLKRDILHFYTWRSYFSLFLERMCAAFPAQPARTVMNRLTRQSTARREVNRQPPNEVALKIGVHRHLRGEFVYISSSSP